MIFNMIRRWYSKNPPDSEPERDELVAWIGKEFPSCKTPGLHADAMIASGIGSDRAEAHMEGTVCVHIDYA